MNGNMMKMLDTLIGKSVSIITDHATITSITLQKVDMGLCIVSGYKEAAGKWLYAIDADKVTGFYVNDKLVPANNDLLGMK